MISGMYRQSIGSIIEKIQEMRQELNSEVNDMTKLLAETDPETYGRFLKYTYGKYEVIDTPDYIKNEINNFDFDSVGHLSKDDLSGKCVIFIFLVDMFTDEFVLPLEFVNNFNYVRSWAKEKIKRREQLNKLEKEFKEET